MNHYIAPEEKPLAYQCPARSSRKFMKHPGWFTRTRHSRIRQRRNK